MAEGYDPERLQAIVDVLIAYSKHEFDTRLEIDDTKDPLHPIITGINLMGEELSDYRTSLNEKERLLKEVHHRIKNNMQIISSLLKLQHEQEADTRFTAFIQDAQNRINAMALVHQMLYNSMDLEHTHFQEYVNTLTENILKSYDSSYSKIRIESNIPSEAVFAIDKTIPLGLIINEIVTNSVKHAFNGKPGKIDISLDYESDEQFCLRVQDNGGGLKTDFDFKEDARLGMQLIHMLAEQIDLRSSTVNGNGLCYIFETN